MADMLREKARQNRDFRDELVKSGDKVICEDFPDRFWGIGSDGKGKNKLGEILMKIRQEVKRNNERELNMPRCAVIGSSLLYNLNPDLLSRKFVTEKHTAYTIPQAEQKLECLRQTPDVIVYQLLSNDLKTDSEDLCVAKMGRLVALTKRSRPGAKIIVSLPLNRSDSHKRNNKTNMINARVTSLFAEDDTVWICDNSNLAYRGKPSRKHIGDDGVHPTPHGEMVLFNNIRQAVEDVLTPNRSSH